MGGRFFVRVLSDKALILILLVLESLSMKNNQFYLLALMCAMDIQRIVCGQSVVFCSCLLRVLGMSSVCSQGHPKCDRTALNAISYQVVYCSLLHLPHL